MRDFTNKVNGNTYEVEEFNGVLAGELENLPKSTNQTLFTGGQNDPDTNTNQLAIAAAVYAAGGDFYTDSGSANTYVLSPISVGGNTRLAPHAYQDGMSVRFIVGNSNTGASTVNVDSIGVKNIKKLEGGSFQDLESSDLSEDFTVVLEYNVTEDAFILIYSSQVLETSGEVSISVFTSSDTYIPPPGVKALKITAVGAGGGSGGVDGQGAGTAATSVAGAGGATAISLISKSSIASSYTITVGAGGTGGTGSGGGSGTTGGTTSVVGGSLNLVAVGGAGGAGQVASSSLSIKTGAIGGTPSGGNLVNLFGGGTGLGGSNSGGPLGAHPGGASFYGSGGAATNGAVGLSSGNPGAGGGSVTVVVSSDNFNGGNGGNGRVIIEEYK